MIATKGGHAIGIRDYFDLVELYCVRNYDRIPLTIKSCSCLVWLNVESSGTEYWLVYMLGYMESKLELEIGSMWDYGVPMQRCWQLLRCLYGGSADARANALYDSDWLVLDKLRDRFYKLVFGGVWR